MTRPFSDLEDEFSAACDTAVEECIAPGYAPRTWTSMIATLGAAEAARRLVISGDVQSGFERLAQLGRPDLTIEQAVLNARWAPLFSEQHREAARWRLRQAGIDAEDG